MEAVGAERHNSSAGTGPRLPSGAGWLGRAVHSGSATWPPGRAGSVGTTDVSIPLDDASHRRDAEAPRRAPPRWPRRVSPRLRNRQQMKRSSRVWVTAAGFAVLPSTLAARLGGARRIDGHASCSTLPSATLPRGGVSDRRRRLGDLLRGGPSSHPRAAFLDRVLTVETWTDLTRRSCRGPVKSGLVAASALIPPETRPSLPRAGGRVRRKPNLTVGDARSSSRSSVGDDAVFMAQGRRDFSSDHQAPRVPP